MLIIVESKQRQKQCAATQTHGVRAFADSDANVGVIKINVIRTLCVVRSRKPSVVADSDHVDQLHTRDSGIVVVTWCPAEAP